MNARSLGKLVVLVFAPKEYCQAILQAFCNWDLRGDVEIMPYITCEEDVERLKPHIQAVNVVYYGSGKVAGLVKLAWPHLANVKWIHSQPAGVDQLLNLVPELKILDIQITNSKGVFSHSLAEYTLAACNWFAKRLDTIRSNQQKSQWLPITIEELRGRTFGILGYGDIGRECAILAKAYKMRVIVVRRNLQQAQSDLQEGIVDDVFSPDNVKGFISHCDYCVNVLPSSPATYHYVGQELISCMKRNLVFINIGRGATVDESALVKALLEQRIKGAALDVAEIEPLPSSSPLYRLDNVLLSAHTAYNTGDTWRKDSVERFKALLQDYREGRGLGKTVDKEQGY